MRRVVVIAATLIFSGLSFAQEKAATSATAQSQAAPSDSTKETYDGVPLCHNRHGVFPHSIYRTNPEYDEKDRKKKIEGVVALSAIITTEGKLVDFKLIKTLTPGLDQQAIKSVSQWRFEPMVEDGQPCPTRMTVQVSFKLY